MSSHAHQTATDTSARTNQSGVAIITALLVLMLVSGLMAGMFAALLADQRSHAADRDQSVAYAAAHAGLEKLTASLATLVNDDVSPSAAQVRALSSTPPAIPGVEYTAPGGDAGSGYQISFTPDPNPGANFGNPIAVSADLTTGPFAGLKGILTRYDLTVTAKSESGRSEVRLHRELQTVAVPVFQFGVFGEKSLSFFAGPNFRFGGRVHTNHSLHLSSGSASTLTFDDKITAFDQVVRNRLMNGVSISLINQEGVVSVPVDIGSGWRNLAVDEASGTEAAKWDGWKHLSEVTYKTNISTSWTGAKTLTLPLTTLGEKPIEIIRRPAPLSNEHVSNAAVYSQRLYAQASLRILLSDRAADITSLPTVTSSPPFNLANLAAHGLVAGAGRPPVALSPGAEPNSAGTPLTRLELPSSATPTLTLETAPSPTGSWTAGVPQWLKWTDVRYGSSAPGTALPCTGISMTPMQLTGCGTHSALSDNTVIRINRPGYPEHTGFRVSGTNSANSATIALKSSSTAQLFAATRVFFIGEDPVTCTGFTATQLLGCTWNATATINSKDPVYSGASTPRDEPLLAGYIKIERQSVTGTWSDVTLELLNLGFAGPNQEGDRCNDPTPSAVIRLQRLRDSGLPYGQCSAAGTNYSTSLDAHDFWPNTLFDAMESSSRSVPIDAGMNAGGLFGYVALDVENFKKWVTGAIGSTGAQARNNNGYIVYFSDRRGNHDTSAAGEPETAEYGFEDSLNPRNAVWAKDNVLNDGEDVNEDARLQTYGETPYAPIVPAGALPGFDAASRPWTNIALKHSGRGRLARPVLFRRAIKIVNGGFDAAGNNRVPADGFTLASENPVYVQGNFNATSDSANAEPNAPTSVMADAVTLLSNAFADAVTFRFPNDMRNRRASGTGYRFAMITGSGVPFPWPAWSEVAYGSGGGVNNLMKLSEDWGGHSLHYKGSMVTLYYSRQATGTYHNAGSNTFSAPTRYFSFDSQFLSPSLLPPGTPMFRDINSLKFRQILRPLQ